MRALDYRSGVTDATFLSADTISLADLIFLKVYLIFHYLEVWSSAIGDFWG